MFDIGFSELLVIAVVALLVLGPERLPKAARFAGLWVRKARQQWYSVKSEFERDLAADELQRSLKETRESLREAEEQLRTSASSIRTQVEQGLTGAAVVATPETLAPPGAVEGESTETLPPASDRQDPAQQEPDEDEHDRPLGSSLEMDDLEPPPPSDADDEGEFAEPPPPPHPDAHAGR